MIRLTLAVSIGEVLKISAFTERIQIFPILSGVGYKQPTGYYYFAFTIIGAPFTHPFALADQAAGVVASFARPYPTRATRGRVRSAT